RDPVLGLRVPARARLIRHARDRLRRRPLPRARPSDAHDGRCRGHRGGTLVAEATGTRRDLLPRRPRPARWVVRASHDEPDELHSPLARTTRRALRRTLRPALPDTVPA